MESNSKKTFAVQGMSCPGCETIIEKVLSELDGVAKADADFLKRKVEVIFDPEKTGYEKMSGALADYGYELKNISAKNNHAPKSDSAQSFSTVQFAGIVIALGALYLIISNTVGFNFIPEISSSMGYGVLFSVGLMTSLHCVAMCGGINLSQCAHAVGTKTRTKQNLKPSLLYNLGRVTSYTLLGGLIGALGAVVSFSGWTRGIVAILSGLFMMMMGLSMTGLMPGLSKLMPRIPAAFGNKAKSAGQGKGPFIVGLLNGLMPCGPLQAMQLYALGTGSFAAGALSMFFFSLGTLPLMFGLGAIVTMLGNKFTKNMMKVSAALVVVLGIVMLGRGLVLSGISLPTLAPVSQTAVSESSVVVENGVQSVTSTLTSSGYPNITVQKDVPVSWNLQADSGSINGCNDTLILSEFGLQVGLQPGDNIIEFTPTEAGTIVYSCWMGMQTGTITVVE